MRLFRWFAYQIAWLRWEHASPFNAGDPALGDSRDERNANIHILMERHYAKEPKREDYGL